MARCACIGLGVMGYPMAGHLLKKGGHNITAYNRNSAEAAKRTADGGRRGLAEAGKHGARLPVTALLDQFYAQVQARGEQRRDTSSLMHPLAQSMSTAE